MGLEANEGSLLAALLHCGCYIGNAMTMLPGMLVLCALCLFADGVRAQQAEPGTGSTQVAPASAAPQTQAQPDLRTDSKPHTNEDASADSGPLPETLGMDATPIMDMGLDWSLPQNSNQPAVLKRIVTRKGQVSVEHVQTAPVVARPVCNPPEPRSRILTDVPQPPSTLKPTPPDPLAGIPQ